MARPITSWTVYLVPRLRCSFHCMITAMSGSRRGHSCGFRPGFRRDRSDRARPEVRVFAMTIPRTSQTAASRFPASHVRCQARKHGQGGGDQLAAVCLGGFDSIDVEHPQFGALAAGIHHAQQGASDQIAADRQVIAGGEDRGVDRGFGIAALSQDPDVQLLLGQHLTQEAALEDVIAVVQRDRRVSRQQRCAQAFLQLLLVVAPARSPALVGRWRASRRRRPAGFCRCPAVGEVERMQGRGCHGAAIEGGQDRRQRDRAVRCRDERERAGSDARAVPVPRSHRPCSGIVGIGGKL